jgi:ABC-type spermidine/putrescine transport systems, ATPase components
MRYEIKELQKKFGITVVFVTHDQIEAMTMSDRVFVINHGIVQQVGTPYEIYRKPANQFVADFVGKVNFIKGNAAAGKVTFTGIDGNLPYDGALRGNVIVTIRPENIEMTDKEDSTITGKLTKLYFLGNENDCYIDVNGTTIRTIAPPQLYGTLKVGQDVYLKFADYLVHEGDVEDGVTEIVN